MSRTEGTAAGHGPAPQTAVEEDGPAERLWTRTTGADPVAEEKAEEYLARQYRFDPDLWVVEVEARDGMHLLDAVVD